MSAHGFAVGEIVLIAVGSLEGASATVEAVGTSRSRYGTGRRYYWVRVDPLFPDSLAGHRLAYGVGELDVLETVGPA